MLWEACWEGILKHMYLSKTEIKKKSSDVPSANEKQSFEFFFSSVQFCTKGKLDVNIPCGVVMGHGCGGS